MRTRSAGANHSASAGSTPNASWKPSRLRTTWLHRNSAGECGSIASIRTCSASRIFSRQTVAQDGSEPAEVDGYRADQRLFLSWGSVWQTKIRTEMLRQRMATDPHAPAEFRCNQIVRNLPEFYRAFEVTESDALWLDEGQRVKIW